jgi:hypothetical protein
MGFRFLWGLKPSLIYRRQMSEDKRQKTEDGGKEMDSRYSMLDTRKMVNGYQVNRKSG